MHYELIAQCSSEERTQIIQKIEMSGGRIRDILEDQDGLLLFIEYDDSIALQERLHWLETLSSLVTQIGDILTFPTSTA